MQQAQIPIQLFLIGLTGSWKSSLGNFLLGEKLFKVYDSKSGTQYIEKKERNGLTIIDSPGLGLDNSKDEEHFKQLIYFIKSQNYLNGIIIVMNSQVQRFYSDIQAMMKMICNSFEPKSFKFIAIVFTRFYGKRKEKERTKNFGGFWLKN